MEGPSRDWGCDGGRVFRTRSLTEGGYVAWVLRLVEIGAEGEGSCADVLEISLSIGKEPGPRSASNRAPCSPTGASWGGTAFQLRFLKRQLSLPVSMMSQ